MIFSNRNLVFRHLLCEWVFEMKKRGMKVNPVKCNALVNFQHKVRRVHEGDNINVHRNMELRNEHFCEVGACEAVFIGLLTAKPSPSSSFKRYDSAVG